MRNSYPQTPSSRGCFPAPPTRMLALLLSPHHLPTASPRPSPSCLPTQTMLPLRPRSLSPSQPGLTAWPGSMPRSTSSVGKQRGPADPARPKAAVTAGSSRRRSNGSFESGPGPRRRSCVRAEPGKSWRLPGTKGRSQAGPGLGLSTRKERGGAASGALVMCPGPALGEGTQRPWLQPWWPGALPWRSRGL